MKLLVKESKKSVGGNSKYNNAKNLKISILEIKKNLERQAKNV